MIIEAHRGPADKTEDIKQESWKKILEFFSD